MSFLEQMPLTVAAVAAAACVALVLLALVAWRMRRRPRARPGLGRSAPAARPEGQALLARYAPSAVRVLTASEREALDLVREALPDHLVMAQVPLVRYLRVQDKQAEDDWLRGLSMLSADILVCDGTSRPLLAIDVLPPHPGTRSRERHERMRELLEGVGIGMLVWHEGRLPPAANLRLLLETAMQARRGGTAGTVRPARAPGSPRRSAAARPGERIEPELGLDPQDYAPTSPPPAERAPSATPGPRSARPAAAPAGTASLSDFSRLLAEGDEIAARHPSLDPVSLTFFDEFEPRPRASSPTAH